ncbi:MAG: hydroxyethylthiazole kinase [Endozoicomonas sp.]
MYAQITACLDRVRSGQPLIHNITNQVVTNNTANALLAIGASPIMSSAPEEVCDMVSLSGALVINTGTLSSGQVSSMLLAVEKAGELNKPWVLDPVGAGATAFRLRENQKLLALKPTVIRGNASEILALLTGRAGGKGVDSEDSSDSTLDFLQSKARELGTVIAVTGATDYIANGERLARIDNGDPMMSRVTGTGCTATALTGAFLATTECPWLATVASLTCLGIAGELAALDCPGPGSLQLRLLDQLYRLNGLNIEQRLKIKT